MALPRTTPLFATARPSAWPVVPGARTVRIVLGGLSIALGSVMPWLGVQIAWLGDGLYCTVAALMLLGAGGPVLIGHDGWGVPGLGAFLALTVALAPWEIAAKTWMAVWGFDLAGRIAVPGALYGLALAAMLPGTPRAPGTRWQRPAGLGLVVAGLARGAGLAAAFRERPGSAADTGIADAGATAAGHNTAGEWTDFGGSPLGARHTPSTQITRANVADLREVWRASTGDLPPDDRANASAQNTPIPVEGRLDTCTPSNRVLALDPGTGETLWSFDPGVDPAQTESLFPVACRAVRHHRQTVAENADEDVHAGPAHGACAARIFLTTADSRLIALDAATGAHCPGFGDGGVVALAEGLGLSSSTAGPAVIGDLVLVGQRVSNDQRRDAPSGVVRAYDRGTGARIWALDARRQGIAAEPLADGETLARRTPNVWTVISGDPEAGIVYLGIANCANDHWGGTSIDKDDRFPSNVSAVEMDTSETIWDVATVIHDVWDDDIGAQPALMDPELDGDTPRVVKGTKAGFLLVLDAVTGEPLRPVDMIEAPQGALPGDRMAKAHATAYPNFAGRIDDAPELLDHRHTWGVAMIDAALCRRDVLRRDYSGIFGPSSETPHGMLLFPGTIGGMNWGGVGLDQGRGLVETNNSALPNVLTMHPRDEVRDLPVGLGGARPDQEIHPNWRSPSGVTRPMWLSVLGAPCIAPPWGYLAATDLASGQPLWSQPLGTGYDTGPMGLPTFLRVPLVTALGLTFIAAAPDDFLRAFETDTRWLLWSARLLAGGQASPMGYDHDGRQYAVIVAAGHVQPETTMGDHIVAFALED